MNLAPTQRRCFEFTFAKGVVCFALVCGLVLFKSRDHAHKPTGKRNLLTVSSTLASPSVTVPKTVPPPPLKLAVAPPVASGALFVPKKTVTLIKPVHHARIRRHHNRHLRKHLAKAKPKAKIRTAPPAVSDLDQPEPKWIEQDLAKLESADAEQAYDLFDAASERLQQALNEPSQIEDSHVPGTIPWQFDQNMLADREILPVHPYGEFAPQYVRNSFSEIRERLAALSKQAGELPEVTGAPESRVSPIDVSLSNSVPPTGTPMVKPISNALTSGLVDARAAVSGPSVTVGPTGKSEQVRPHASDIIDSDLAPPAATVTLATAPAVAAETAVDTGPVLVDTSGVAAEAATTAMGESKTEPEPVMASPMLTTHLEPTLVSPAQLPLSIPKPVTQQPITQPTLVRPNNQMPPAAPVVGTGASTANPKANVPAVVIAARTASRFFISRPRPTGRRAQSDEREIDEILYGEIAVDEELSHWLLANKSHIELNLRPEGSRDPQDTVFVDYQYPAPDFQVDMREMEGSYRLLADIYTSSSRAPYAQVVYPTVISADTAKQKVRLQLSLRDLEQNKYASPRRRKSLVLTGALFEGAAGDYRSPKAITGGNVQVVGFPEWGSLRVEPDGTFHIPNVPSESELLLQIQSGGFYSTYQAVPTFVTDPYSPVYLIAKDKVDFITRYFTHHLQNPSYGLLMGRVFDPTTRVPLKGERLSVSFRRGGPIYFSAVGALPMVPGVDGSSDSLATTDNGMFAFFNLRSSMRSLDRASEKSSLLFEMHPQSAQYVELGRGGVGNIRGRILDRRTPVPARVRIVGDKHFEADTDAQGTFVIPGVDLPPGVVTLEVEARGYPISWYTISWNPRESETTRSLYLVDKDLIYEGAATAARVKPDSRLGLLIGQNAIFPKQASCVYVSLTDSNGGSVAPAQGPFSLVNLPDNSSQKLCLTRQSPWFSYFNLNPGEYVLKLSLDNGRPVRTHVVRVGINRVSISVN